MQEFFKKSVTCVCVDAFVVTSCYSFCSAVALQRFWRKVRGIFQACYKLHCELTLTDIRLMWTYIHVLKKKMYIYTNMKHPEGLLSVEKAVDLPFYINK